MGANTGKTIGLAFGVLTLAAGAGAHAQSVQQASEAIDLETGEAVRGAGVLTRRADEVSLRLSAMELDKKAAYTVWWVVFNEPENCLTPFACGVPDIFSAPGVLNQDQIMKAKISVFYADGFVTGTDGVAYARAHLEAGPLPEGTDVDFGWGQEFGDPSMLMAGNGLHAEIHVVTKTHGQAVAGSVGVQTSTFAGLCDVQDCEDQLVIVFPSPDAE